MPAPDAVRTVRSSPCNRLEGSHVLAYDYPLLGAFWTLVLFSLFLLVIFVIVWAFVDNFRRKDHSGWAKAGWFILIIFFPLLGVFIYLIARPADPPL
jgi:phage shock protein PspC (stress-responsive transcriptional regulator)